MIRKFVNMMPPHRLTVRTRAEAYGWQQRKKKELEHGVNITSSKITL